MLMFGGLGIWMTTRSSIPDTVWYGRSCVSVETVSKQQFWEGRTEVESAILKALDGSTIRAVEVDFVEDGSGQSNTVNARVQGFIDAKTITAARSVFADKTDVLYDVLESFENLGVFDTSSCGLNVRLPVNRIME